MIFRFDANKEIDKFLNQKLDSVENDRHVLDLINNVSPIYRVEKVLLPADTRLSDLENLENNIRFIWYKFGYAPLFHLNLPEKNGTAIVITHKGRAESIYICGKAV